MASNIPAKLKQAGITPFVVRAAQLEKARPVIAYWCEYWVVNRILAKGLHSADQGCLEFTTALMDKLERTKADQAGNDAILDDMAGQAYVERFAQETLDRAIRPMKANKVTVQTASTFEAAATFFQLINIWGTPDAETEQKIKFCKWNAARIYKAIKAGEDPNDSNPKQDEEHETDGPDLDPNDPEVQALRQTNPPPPTLEDAPDENDRRYLDPMTATVNPRHAPSPAVVSAPTSPPHAPEPVHDQVSPLAPPEANAAAGDYFAPASVEDEIPLSLPSAPDNDPPPSGLGSSALGPSAPLPPSNMPGTPQEYYRKTPFAPSGPSASAPTPPSPSARSYTQSPPPPTTKAYHPSHGPSQPTKAASRGHPAHPSAQPAAATQTQTGYGSGPRANAPHNADDMSIMQAQKHAKWAISALNFEDVPTAIRELRLALNELGAT